MVTMGWEGASTEAGAEVFQAWEMFQAREWDAQQVSWAERTHTGVGRGGR